MMMLRDWVALSRPAGTPDDKMRIIEEETEDGHRRAVYATERLDVGDEFASLPRSLVMTEGLARSSLLGRALAAIVSTDATSAQPAAKRRRRESDVHSLPSTAAKIDVPSQMYLWVFMMGERAKGSRSPFAAYIRCLPTFYDVQTK